MTEKIPPHLDNHLSKKNSDEYSDLLAELARIRKDIEQESLQSSHLSDLGLNREKYQENSYRSGIAGEVNRYDKSLHTNSFRRFYRFDFEHLEREDLGRRNIDFENADFSKSSIDDTNPLRRGTDFKESSYHRRLEQADKKPKRFAQQSKSKYSEIKSNHYRYDEGPVLIPIRCPETRIPKQNSKLTFEKSCDYQPCSQDSTEHADVIDYAALPWGLINQYENESFANTAGNAGNLSLFIGWGAIACGVVIFAQSFFVGSMIWLNYGLPVVALGAVCLFLGIILTILSDKMQYINDLKQSLTAHRILNQPSKKNNTPPGDQNADAEPEDIYDRLVKLQSEINELINEYENP